MKKFQKSLLLILALMLVCLLLPAQGEEAVRVAALKGPTAMGMVQMMDQYPEDYAFTISGAVDEISPMLLKGTVDIAAIPANLGANLYQKTQGGVTVLAVNTLGVLYIAENGDTVHTLEDLRGRTLFASGKGATPEYALNYILKANGLDPETDVDIQFMSEHSECLAALLQTENAVALLPQPFLTTAMSKAPGVRMALDLNEEWAALQAGEENPSALLTGVCVVRTAYLQEHPQKVQEFLTRYALSAVYTQENPEAAAALIGRYGIVTEEVALQALPYCGIVCLTGEEMRSALEGYLQVLFDQNPAAIGGAMPGEDFWYVP